MFASSIKHVRLFLQQEDGPTTVEYAVLLALVIVVCIGAVQVMGRDARHTYRTLNHTSGFGNGHGHGGS